MKVTAEHVPDSQVVLEIEVESERVERSIEQAYRRLASRTNIPGFRPGKAPRHLVERTLGHELLMQEALDKLVPEVYQEAVTESAIDPIARPELEITNLDPVRVKATVSVRPTVNLGAYKDIRVSRQPVAVSDEAIDAEVEVWRRRVAAWEPVDRGLQIGDLVRADLDMVVDGKSLVKEEDTEFLLRDELSRPMPGLVDGLIGAQRGEERSFATTLPQDFRDPALAGVEATYTAKVRELKELKLPELDDDFARTVGEGFEDLAAFRAWVGEGLKKDLEQAEQDRVETAALDETVKGATIEFPQVMVDHEVEHILREQVGPQADARAMERYLTQIGRSEEEVRADITPIATERVKRSLVLSELAKTEEVVADDAEIEEEIERIARGSDELRKAFNTPQFREQIGRSLVTRKTLGRLAELVAVDDAGTAQPPGAKPSATRRASGTTGRKARKTAETESSAAAEA